MAKTQTKKSQVTQVQEEKSEYEEFLTVHEVAANLRVDDTTVRRWIKSGALDAITLPHREKRRSYRIPKSSYDKLFNTDNATKAS